MSKGPPSFRVYNPAPRPKAIEKKTNAGAFRSSPRERGYTPKWDRESLAFRQENPWCRFCAMLGQDRLGAVVDHVVPPRDSKGAIDYKLFWSRSNWQVLCEHHHNVTKQRMEDMARAAGDLTVLRFWCESADNWPPAIRIA